jgi:transposase InsO family protein
MKQRFKSIGLADLCSWFGITRQAYYQRKRHGYEQALVAEMVISEIKSIRTQHSRLGGRKLFHKMESFFESHQIKMGRDAFFDLMREHQLLIQPRKRYHITTNSKHWMRKYPNLIRNQEPIGPNHIWVCDLTYWKTASGHYYISFITDAFSRKIVGYHVADNMEAIESVAALKMAKKTLKSGHTGLIHHSDRGSQYCSATYVRELQKQNIQVSMTENGDPLENAIAERINGIIKGEYLNGFKINNLSHAQEVLKAVVKLYNEERPHSSISLYTPAMVHENPLEKQIQRLWKNYYRKENDSGNEIEKCKPILGLKNECKFVPGLKQKNTVKL